VPQPRDLVLRVQPRAEQQRVVRPQRDRHAGLEQLPQRHVRRVRCDAERDIGRRADLERDGLRGEPLDQRRVLDGTDAMPDPVGVQHVQAGRDAGRAGQLAAVRDEHQPGPPGDAERAPEFLCRAAPLVVGQAEAGDAAPGVLRREPGERPGIQRMVSPVRRDDDRDSDPGRGARRGGRREHELGERGDPAEPVRESRGIGLDLQPARALGHLVLGGLAEQPVHVRRSAQHRAGDVVEPLEPEPPALVGAAQVRRPVLGERGWQVDAMLIGQLDHRRVAHRPGQMQMQVRFGERAERPGHPPIVIDGYLASASNLPIRVTPSSRSASPSA
jgi:hypothetical protein